MEQHAISLQRARATVTATYSYRYNCQLRTADTHMPPKTDMTYWVCELPNLACWPTGGWLLLAACCLLHTLFGRTRIEYEYMRLYCEKWLLYTYFDGFLVDAQRRSSLVFPPSLSTLEKCWHIAASNEWKTRRWRRQPAVGALRLNLTVPALSCCYAHALFYIAPATVRRSRAACLSYRTSVYCCCQVMPVKLVLFF